MQMAFKSFVILFFLSLVTSLQSIAQIPNDPDRWRERPMPRMETIREELNQNLRSGERIKLTDILRNSQREQMNSEVVSISISAQSLMPGPSQLIISHYGRQVGWQLVRRQLSQLTFTLPPSTSLDGLEISTASEIYLGSITSEVIFSRGQNPSPFPRQNPGYERSMTPFSVVKLQIQQQIRGQGVVSLDQILRQQYGLSLRGARLERVVVVHQMGQGAASVQLQLNHRPHGLAKYLSPHEPQTPLPFQSLDEIRKLDLIVNGSAYISEVRIRVGEVVERRPDFPNPGPTYPEFKRFEVREEIFWGMPLELSRILGSRERLIRSLTFDLRPFRQMPTRVMLLNRWNEQLGVILVGSQPLRATLHLKQPMSAQELSIEAASEVFVNAIEVEFDSYPRF